MPVKTLIKPSEYHDSVSLMLVAQELAKPAGRERCGCGDGDRSQQGHPEEAGLLTPEAAGGLAQRPGDRGQRRSEARWTTALAEAEKLLQQKQSCRRRPASSAPRPLRSALKANSRRQRGRDLGGRALCRGMKPGRRCAGGLHVLLFSDNVSLEDEIALKHYAAEHGLLLMGPGAGTAILNGVALGFANVLPPGPVGIVSAAGTGLQEVSTLLAKHGVGITQGIGTGGRDLKEEVGGIMMLAGLESPAGRPGDPGDRAGQQAAGGGGGADRCWQQVCRATSRPWSACWVVSCTTCEAQPWSIRRSTLEEAALLAARLARPRRRQQATRATDAELRTAAELRQRLQPGQRYLRGLFSGGTLCYEAQVIWRDLLTRAGLLQCAAGEGTAAARFDPQPGAQRGRPGRGRVHRRPAAPHDR